MARRQDLQRSLYEEQAPARAGNPLFCHQDLLEKMGENRANTVGRRAALLLHRLLVDIRRQYYKTTQGENRGWRRSPLGGSHGAAGEIGHIRVTEGGLPCGCGGRGCVETLASVSALIRRYILARGQVVSVTEIVERAEGGEAAAQTIWGEAIAALGAAVAAAVAVLDCDLVVLGGELAEAAGAVLIRALGAELEGRLSVVPAPELSIAALGDAAACLGAAGAAFERAGMGRGFRLMEPLN